MTKLWLAGIAVAVLGCRQYVPPTLPGHPPVTLSIEVSNAAGGGVPGVANTVRVENESKMTLRAIRDYTQAVSASQYKFAVRDAGGQEFSQKGVLIGTPPLAPREEDYVTIKPGQIGEVAISLSSVVRAYDLKPGRLYFIEVRIRFEGLPDPATLVVPFGYAEARKD